MTVTSGESVARARTVGSGVRRRSAPGGYRGDIDGLRAISVLLVVAFHAGLPFVTGGFVGVDVFFVISGFLITGMLLAEQAKGGLSLADFYARRVRRLLPLSALVLVTTAAACALWIPPIDRARAAGDIGFAGLYSSNWHFAAQATDYMASDGNVSPVLHYWSLSVEEQFYLVWPLLIIAAVAAGRIKTRWMPTATQRVGLVLAILGVGSWLLSALTTETNGPFAYFGIQTRAWELAAGAGLAMARPLLPRLPRAPAALAGWFGLGLIVWSALSLNRETPFPGTAATYPVLGAVLVLGAGARVTGAGVAGLLSGRRLRYVGRLSYSWYLWHWPFLVLLQERLGDDGASGASATAIAVTASFGVAALTHHLVENPARRSVWLSATRGRSLSAGVALTLVSVVAAVALARTGEQVQQARPITSPVVPVAGAAPVLLTMTPEQARADVVTGMRDCHVVPKVTEAADDCVFGDPNGKTTVALVGDSHAQQWFPAMQAMAVQRHWRLLVWTKDACLFLATPVWSQNYQRPYPECDAWRGNVERQLKKAGHLSAVVIARTAYDRYLTVGDDGTLIPESHKDQLAGAWAAGARRTFATLGAFTDHIVMLVDNPHAPTDVPRCLSSAGAAVAKCAFPRAVTPAGDVSYGAELDGALVTAEHSVKTPKVAWIDLTDQLCTATICPAVDGSGIIIYRNHNHLTVTKVLDLQAVLGSRLTGVMSTT